MAGSKKYGVKLVRGPVLAPDPHPLACEDEAGLAEMLRTSLVGKPRAVDLFCGAGGLSLGLEQAGYSVIAAVDTDPEALATHRSLCPGLSVDWDLAQDENVERIGRLVRDFDVEVLSGGPPCQPFSKAGRSMLRHLVREGKRDAKDLRAGLWQSFLRVVEIGRPRAVLMENVPDMVLDRDMLVIRTMTDELEQMGYSVTERLVKTRHYGVPQHRQRLILVALADGVSFEWPQQVEEEVTLRQAISDLPAVEGGWRPEGGAEGYLPYEVDVESPFVKEMRRYMAPEDRDRVHDHVTRPVREDDARAFAVMDPTTKYSDLPDELKRYRDDIFDDKYKRLAWDDFCRTITAHISKDGYWYIHPDQDRTLTVREAARVQTFPDHVRFAGSPTAAFRQIGNAVPVRLGFHMGTAIRRSLEQPVPANGTVRERSQALADWMLATSGDGQTSNPVIATSVAELAAGAHPEQAHRWHALVLQTMLTRMPREQLADAWTVLVNELPDAATAVGKDALLDMMSMMYRRSARIEDVRRIRDALVADQGALGSPEGLESLDGVSRALARLTCRLVPGPESDPVEGTAPLLRLAARFWGSNVHEQDRMSDGRLAVAGLMGVDDETAPDPRTRFRAALASLALFELADQVCTPSAPQCGRCPLQGECATAASSAMQTVITVPGAATPR